MHTVLIAGGATRTPRAAYVDPERGKTTLRHVLMHTHPASRKIIFAVRIIIKNGRELARAFCTSSVGHVKVGVQLDAIYAVNYGYLTAQYATEQRSLLKSSREQLLSLREGHCADHKNQSNDSDALHSIPPYVQKKDRMNG